MRRSLFGKFWSWLTKRLGPRSACSSVTQFIYDRLGHFAILQKENFLHRLLVAILTCISAFFVSTLYFRACISMNNFFPFFLLSYPFVFCSIVGIYVQRGSQKPSQRTGRSDGQSNLQMWLLA